MKLAYSSYSDYLFSSNGPALIKKNISYRPTDKKRGNFTYYLIIYTLPSTSA